MSPRYQDLGPLEMEVVGHLEDHQPLSVAEIQRRLKSAGRDLAYTTVMTVLTRLHNKGILSRKKEGRQFLYQPESGKARVGRSVLSKVSTAIFRNEGLQPILTLLDTDREISRDQLLELRRIVDKKIREKGGGG